MDTHYRPVSRIAFNDLSRVILSQEVKESCSLYIHNYILRFVLRGFLHTVLLNTNNFQTYLFNPKSRPYQVQPL